jgi:hypothetical protein
MLAVARPSEAAIVRATGGGSAQAPYPPDG